MEDSNTYTGTVVNFSNKKNFGFIEWCKNNLKQNDMFVHYSDIEMEGYKTLSIGQQVSFKIGINHEGRPKAIEVNIIE